MLLGALLLLCWVSRSTGLLRAAEYLITPSDGMTVAAIALGT